MKRERHLSRLRLMGGALSSIAACTAGAMTVRPPMLAQAVTGRDANHQQSFAETVAAALQISVNGIGVTGATTANIGNRALFVVYAWQRGPGESGPRLYGTPPPTLAVDATVALALVERHLPDAFVGEASSTGTPTLLLSTQGKMIRAGCVQLNNGGLTQSALQSSVLNGARIGQIVSQTLLNASGLRRDGLLAWQADPGANEVVRP